MSQTVLVADDNLTIQRMALEMLSPQGLQVVTVANGVAALKKLPLVQPQLVVADVDMPGKDGYEVCGFIKNSPELKHIWVLLAASDSDPYDGERGASAGADGFVKKPFNRDDLVAAVVGLLDRLEGGVELRETGQFPDGKVVETSAEGGGERQEEPEPIAGEELTALTAESAASVDEETDALPAPVAETPLAEYGEAPQNPTLYDVLEATEAATCGAGQEMPATEVANEVNTHTTADAALVTDNGPVTAAPPEPEWQRADDGPDLMANLEPAALPEEPEALQLPAQPETLQVQELQTTENVAGLQDETLVQQVTLLEEAAVPQVWIAAVEPLWACPDEQALLMQCDALPEAAPVSEHPDHGFDRQAEAGSPEIAESQHMTDSLQDLPAAPEDLPVAAMAEVALPQEEAPLPDLAWSHDLEPVHAAAEPAEWPVEADPVLASTHGDGENRDLWSDAATKAIPELSAQPAEPAAENRHTLELPVDGAAWPGSELLQAGERHLADAQTAEPVHAAADQPISSAQEPAAAMIERDPEAEAGETALNNDELSDETTPVFNPEEFATTSVALLSAASPVMVVPSLTPADFNAPQMGPAIPETEWIARIVQKTVSRMAPNALPAEVVTRLAQKITDEVIVELAFDPRPAP